MGITKRECDWCYRESGNYYFDKMEEIGGMGERNTPKVLNESKQQQQKLFWRFRGGRANCYHVGG